MDNFIQEKCQDKVDAGYTNNTFTELIILPNLPKIGKSLLITNVSHIVPWSDSGWKVQCYVWARAGQGREK